MLVYGGFASLLILALWLWALFDCISTDAALCRNLPKGVWLILVLLIPLIGSIAWLLLGRPERAGWRPGSTNYASGTNRPLGLEDHPRYSSAPGVSDRRSAELDDRLAEWEREEAAKRALEASQRPPAIEAASGDRNLDAWEADLQQREDDLRRRELEARERELQERERETPEA